MKRPWRHPTIFEAVKPKVFVDGEYKVVVQPALKYCYMEYATAALKEKLKNGGREIKGMQRYYIFYLDTMVFHLIKNW